MNKNISKIKASDYSYIKIDYKDGDLLKVALVWDSNYEHIPEFKTICYT